MERLINYFKPENYNMELRINKYTEEEYQAFANRLSELDQYDTCDIERLKEIFISIYANPVNNI